MHDFFALDPWSAELHLEQARFLGQLDVAQTVAVERGFGRRTASRLVNANGLGAVRSHGDVTVLGHSQLPTT